MTNLEPQKGLASQLRRTQPSQNLHLVKFDLSVCVPKKGGTIKLPVTYRCSACYTIAGSGARKPAQQLGGVPRLSQMVRCLATVRLAMVRPAQQEMACPEMARPEMAQQS